MRSALREVGSIKLLGRNMKYKRTIICVTILASVCAAVFLPKSEHSRKLSPDGKQVAIVYSRAFWSVVPVFPGGGSDSPGWIRIETTEGKKLKEYRVEMLWLIQDLRWENGIAYLPLHEPE